MTIHEDNIDSPAEKNAKDNALPLKSAESVGALPQREFEGYINKRECARLLGRTVRSIDTYMAEGIIPFYKLGRTVLFKWSEVDAHIQARFRVCLR